MGWGGELASPFTGLQPHRGPPWEPPLSLLLPYLHLPCSLCLEFLPAFFYLFESYSSLEATGVAPLSRILSLTTPCHPSCPACGPPALGLFCSFQNPFDDPDKQSLPPITPRGLSPAGCSVFLPALQGWDYRFSLYRLKNTEAQKEICFGAHCSADPRIQPVIFMKRRHTFVP